ncbi:MAG: hypothetical protein C0507_20015 [Cyanobacteria bacterium PR.3.49]|jgi:uncharacterized surface protein with fasciclin (FAS1) repeats|nr:hypothetical protein [Cyanobacteria bacterium PR.3.49]
MFCFRVLGSAALALSLAVMTGFNAADAKSSSDKSKSVKIAAKTTKYSEKEGFERKKLDIINTLKENEVTRFMTLRDGLTQAFELDKVLKGNGPFTFLAPSDDAFKHYPADDLSQLFDNKKKLRQVLEYHIIPGNYRAADLAQMGTVKTMEGHSVSFSNPGGDYYADKSLMKVIDIPCTNGMLHVLDRVIQPPLAK